MPKRGKTSLEEDVSQKLLFRGFHEAGCETYPKTFSFAREENLFAVQADNRDSASWKKAQHVFVCEPPTKSISEVVDMWKLVTKKDNQKLQQIYVATSNGKYKVFDSDGHYIGEDTLEYFFESTTTIATTGKYAPILAAIRTKPFLLLAGISGTGKSRIAREIARSCWDETSPEFQAQVPPNFRMIPVRPNWHDSTELLGYYSTIDHEFKPGPFLRAVVDAWKNRDMPFVVCLDEMNLAPVEQYFAEYLSVIESRKFDGTAKEIVTDPLVEFDRRPVAMVANQVIEGRACRDERKSSILQEALYALLKPHFPELENTLQDIRKTPLGAKFLDAGGIPLPPNLVVIGTVNMDETTYSFSRKVLDRAMTVEMNEIDFHSGLDATQRLGIGAKLELDDLCGKDVEGFDVYDAHTEVCDAVIGYLEKMNEALAGSPFRVAYRTRNEAMIYVLQRIGEKPLEEAKADKTFQQALDEITMMKILPRIEGEAKKTQGPLEALGKEVEAELGEKRKTPEPDAKDIEWLSLAKIAAMKKRIAEQYFCSFWD